MAKTMSLIANMFSLNATHSMKLSPGLIADNRELSSIDAHVYRLRKFSLGMQVERCFYTFLLDMLLSQLSHLRFRNCLNQGANVATVTSRVKLIKAKPTDFDIVTEYTDNIFCHYLKYS